MTLSACGSIDGAVSLAADLLDSKKAAGVPEPCEVLIAGISETSGPTMAYFATADVYGLPEFEPWTLYNVTGEWGGGPQPTPEEIADFDLRNGLAACGTAIFEAMRRKPGPNPTRPELPEIYGIGGHVDHTVIDANGARTSRLHTWPDRIGDKIEPFGF